MGLLDGGQNNALRIVLAIRFLPGPSWIKTYSIALSTASFVSFFFASLLTTGLEAGCWAYLGAHTAPGATVSLTESSVALFFFGLSCILMLVFGKDAWDQIWSGEAAEKSALGQPIMFKTLKKYDQHTYSSGYGSYGGAYDHEI